MALQDILAAITAKADKKIEQARADLQKENSQLRQESEKRIAKRKQEIEVSKQQKLDQMKAKAETHASAVKRNAVLSKKKELLDRLYGKVAEDLAELSDKEIEPLLRKCVKGIKAKGEIYPSKKHAALLKKICPSEQFRIKDPKHFKGGFLFVSEREEQDFTFEHLVEEVLRPKTELETSHTLFS